jgi:hypothetical protein
MDRVASPMPDDEPPAFASERHLVMELTYVSRKTTETTTCD